MANPIERLTPEVIDRLTALSDPWLSCDDCFDQIDGAIDAVLGDGTPLDEPLRVHLLSCGVCHEEALSLAELVASDHDLAEVQATDRLNGAISNGGH